MVGLTPEIVKEISDLGILLGIGVIIVVFVAKILDFLLGQAKTVSNSVEPKLNKILTDMSVIKTEIIGVVTAHNTSSGTTFLRILSSLEDIRKKLDRIDDDNQRIMKNQDMILHALRLQNERGYQVITELVRRGVINNDSVINITETDYDIESKLNNDTWR